jgi:hypothetical protein
MDALNHIHRIIVYFVQRIRRNVMKDIVMHFQLSKMVNVKLNINNVQQRLQIVLSAIKTINVQLVNKDINLMQDNVNWEIFHKFSKLNIIHRMYM